MYMKIILILCFTDFAVGDPEKCKFCKSEDHEGDCRKGTESKLETCTRSEPICVTSMATKSNNMKYTYYYRACRARDYCESEEKKYGKNSYYCRTCSESSECNNEYLFKDRNLTCINCQGKGSDSKCALGTDKTSEKCPPFANSCYLEITVDGSTLVYKRGCGSDNYCPTQKKEYGPKLKYCKVCEANNCNNQNGAGKCLKCKTIKENSECQKGAIDTASDCLINECFQKVAKNYFGITTYERGCVTWNHCSDPQNGETIKFCKTCNDKEKCNSKSMNGPKEGLSCITCTGRDNSCALGESNTSVKCPPNQDVCYEEYLQYGEDHFVRRGCGAYHYCEREKILYGSRVPRCRVCSVSNCNNQRFVPLRCYACESRLADCRTYGTDMPKKTCGKISDVCFHRTYQGEVVISHHRGCAPAGYCEKSVDTACQEYHEDLLNVKQAV